MWPRHSGDARTAKSGRSRWIDAATTHLYEPGLRQHIRNALRYGATKEEIMEVLELVSVLGIHACTLHPLQVIRAAHPAAGHELKLRAYPPEFPAQVKPARAGATTHGKANAAPPVVEAWK